MSIDSVLERAQHDIATYGWHLTLVFPVDDDDGPSFVYTTGLTVMGHPELIAYGGNDTAHMLNYMGRQIRDGRTFVPGLLDLGGAVPAWVLETDPAQAFDHLTISYGFYPNMPAPLQIVVPDKTGRFPWQEECQEPYLSQPILGQPPQ